MSSMPRGRGDRPIPDDVYLQRSGVDALYVESVAWILENRPNDPIKALAEFFDHRQKCGEQEEMPSLTQIRSSPRHRDLFFDNLVGAFRDGRSNKGAMKGSQFVAVVKAASASFPAEQLELLLRLVAPAGTDKGLLTFDDYIAGLNAVILYEEFLLSVERLFALCDAGNGVNPELMDELLVQMTATGRRRGDITNKTRIEECMKGGARVPGRVSLREFSLKFFHDAFPHATGR